MSSLLCYGAYGFVGELIAREATARGADPILAGRDGEELATVARNLDQPARQFDLADPTAVRDALADVDCVLNCAGPFSNTADELVAGCLQTGTDYVDVTGEIPVIERIRGWDDLARDAGVTLFPSAAFSSVPLSCLAAHLAERRPHATQIALGADSFRIPSVGTLKTVIEGGETGGMVYRDGQLEHVPATWRNREIDFGRGVRPAVTMPLGDVSTAQAATRVPNVELYAFVPRPARLALRAHRYVAPAFAATPVQWALKQLAELAREGPSESARRRGSAYLWGEARVEGADEATQEPAVARLRTPDAYVVTVDAAVTVAERVLAGDVDAGYQTPPEAFGPEFVTELAGMGGFVDEGRALEAT